MNKKTNVTLKDISAATGYSLVSIHRAINNKEGLSAETREQILAKVKEMGYEVNYMASSLKRRKMTVAYVGKRREGFTDYHSMMADGTVSAFSQFEGMNLSFKEYYFSGTYSELEEKELKILDEIYEDNEIDGLIVFPINTSVAMQLAIQKIISKGVSVVLVDDGFDNMDFLACVAPFARYVGETAAELMSRVCNKGKILVTRGKPNSISHNLNCNCFVDYFNQFTSGYDIKTFVNDKGEDDLVERLLQNMDDSVVGMYAACETDSSAISKACIKSGRKNLILIGNDLGRDNKKYIEDGVLFAVIDTDPFAQGYFAMRTLLDYMLKKMPPESKCFASPISIVMRSNLNFSFGVRDYGLSITPVSHLN